MLVLFQGNCNCFEPPKAAKSLPNREKTGDRQVKNPGWRPWFFGDNQSSIGFVKVFDDCSDALLLRIGFQNIFDHGGNA